MLSFLSLAKPGRTWPQLVFALKWSEAGLRSSPLEDHHAAEDLRAQHLNPFFIYPPERRLKLVDLQAIVLGFDEHLRLIRHVDGLENAAFDGAVMHSGDELAGGNAGWDETVNLNLEMLPDEVKALALFVHSRSGQPLAQVPGSQWALVNLRDSAHLIGHPIGGQISAPAFATAQTILAGLVVRDAMGGFAYADVDAWGSCPTLDEAVGVVQSLFKR